MSVCVGVCVSVCLCVSLCVSLPTCAVIKEKTFWALYDMSCRLLNT